MAREVAATERYRQQEERDIDRGSSTREDRGSNCVSLVVVVLSCLLLSLAVLNLSGVVLSLAKK